MPNAKISQEIKEARVNGLAPLFAFMNDRGMKLSWLADRLHISRMRLANYKNGWNEVPIEFVEAACQIVGFPRELLHVPTPSTKRSWKSHDREAVIPVQKGA